MDNLGSHKWVAGYNWAHDVREKIAACEAPLQIAATIRQQRVLLPAFAFAPPIILYPVGLAIVWLCIFAIRLWTTVPPHIRRGLLRSYVAIAVPWVAWFGYLACEAHSSAKRSQAFYASFWFRLAVLSCAWCSSWIVAGFRKSAENKSKSS
jgi:hypothetical protein